MQNLNCGEKKKILHSRTPIDWRSPIGYLFTFALQFVTNIYVLRIATCDLNLFIEPCTMLMAFAEDIKLQFNLFAKLAETNENRAKIMGNLSEFIELHADVKRLGIN